MEAGLAIAGVVLGVFPLVIAGFETFKMVLAHDYVKLQRTLSIDQTIYRNCIERLLLDLGEEKRVQDLIDNPKSGAWEEPALKRRLQEQLGRNYSACMAAIEDIKENLEKLQKITALPPAKKHRVRKLVKTLFSAPETEAGLNQLKDRIHQLERIQAHTSSVYITRQSPTRPRAVYEKIRDSAAHLYTALANGWTCSCDTPHQANLLLESRKETSGDNEGGTDTHRDEVVRFRFLFSFCTDLQAAAGNSDDELAQQWRELEIQPLKNAPYRADLSQIEDLCQFIQDRSHGLSHDGQCLGYLHDKPSNNDYGLFTVPTGESASSASVSQPLAEILSPSSSLRLTRVPSSSPGQRSLSLRAGVRLAVILSSALLQLCSTPWLDESLDKEQICFGNNDSITKSDKPYLRRRFGSISSSATTTSPAARSAAGVPWGPNDHLYSLGIILMEIAYHKSLAEIKVLPEVLGDAELGDAAEIMTIKKVLDKGLIAEIIGPRYQGAVYSCIHCNFDLPQEQMKLENPLFQRNILEKVLRPLEENSKNWV